MKETAAREEDIRQESSWREKVERRIGKDLREKHAEIGPLLSLIEYRMEDEAEGFEYGLLRLFIFDTLYGKKAVTRTAAGIISPLLWAYSKAAHRSVPKAKTRLAFSNSFLLSSRYPAARAEIDRETGCTAVLTFTDLLKREAPDQRINLKASLKPEKQQCRPVFFPGRSICGKTLQQAVIRYCNLFYNPGASETGDSAEAALQALEKAYKARVEKIADCLRKEDCALYVTVNQYNLRDLLIIHACKKLGVRTLQQEHHATQFNRLQYDPEHPSYRLSFAGEYGFWSRSEQLFHKKVYRYENELYRPEEIRFRVTGNPEISAEEALRLRQQYPQERKLTLMLASMKDSEIEGKREKYEQWRWSIFKGLRELADRQHIVISIRYSPNRETEFREKEVPVLKEWGFRISESVPGNLMEDLCTSAAIMSSTSSVMCTARMFGKLTFRVEDWEIGYVHVDDEVHEVTPAEIPDIVIPEGIENTLPEIDREAAFSIKALTE